MKMCLVDRAAHRALVKKTLSFHAPKAVKILFSGVTDAGIKPVNTYVYHVNMRALEVIEWKKI